MSTMPGGPFGPPSGIAGARWDDAAIYGLGSGSASSKRDPLSIKDTKEIPRYKFFARIKMRLGFIAASSRVNNAVKYYRRAQIRKSILNALDENSKIYGDRVRVGTKLSINDIIEKADDAVETNGLKAETKGLFKGVRKSVGSFFEKFYAARYRLKAYLSYNKKDKRIDHSIEANDKINYYDKILKQNLFHNYNILGVNLGKIKESDNYDGMLPDPVDIKEVNSNINNGPTPTASRNNTQTQTQQQAQAKAQTQTKTQQQAQAKAQQQQAQAQQPQAKAQQPSMAQPQAKPKMQQQKPDEKIKFTKTDFSSSEYSMKKDQIIQDMPLNDKSEQTFKTNGMTKEELKRAREELFKMLDETNNEKTSSDTKKSGIIQDMPLNDKSEQTFSAKGMSQEEIERARRELFDMLNETEEKTTEQEVSKERHK